MKLMTIESISSKPDSFGNRYHAMQVTNLISGKVLSFTISGDNASPTTYDLFQDWEAVREFCTLVSTEINYRSFKAITKRWPYGGCEAVAKYIIDNGGRPSFYEAVKAHCGDNGIEISNHYSDMYVPVSPSISRLAKAYQYNHSHQFTNNISGKLSYDFPLCFEPYWEAKQKSVQATKESE